MVPITTVCRTNDEHFQNRPFVAVFIGGTQGIGRYAVEALAAQYSTQPSPPLRVYIIGRSQQSADEVLQTCRTRCPHGEFTFIQASDLALISDVDATSSKIIELEKDGRIDLLLQTQAQILFGARKETPEGLDRLLSLIYYSRLRFITNLLPLLAHGGRVISIDAAGMEGKLFREDLSLRDPKHYSYVNVKSHGAYMSTMAFERLAAEYGRVGFVYVAPGVVFGPSYFDTGLPWWFKMFSILLEPILRWTVATPAEEAGERVLFLAGPMFDRDGTAKGTDGNVGSGCYAVGSGCDVLAEKKHAALHPRLRSEGFREEVWAHTMKALGQIEKGQRFLS